jgi:hypothetical protein
MGSDVALKESSVCIVDAKGKMVREAKIASEPECLVRYFDDLDLLVVRVGFEAGPLSQWLHAALVAPRSRAAKDQAREGGAFSRNGKDWSQGWRGIA